MLGRSRRARVRSRLTGSLVPVIEQLEERLVFGGIPIAAPGSGCQGGPEYSSGPVRYFDGNPVTRWRARIR